MKDKRLFAFSFSLIAHLLVLTVSSFAFPNIMPPQFTSPVLLDLISPEPEPEPPVTTSIAAEQMAETVPQIKTPEAPVQPKVDWNKEEFEKKQIQINQKIQAIREQLQKAVDERKAAGKAKGFDLVSAGVSGERWNQYLKEVRLQILKEWQPYVVKEKKKLAVSEARLDFTIQGSGKVEKYEVVEWKGSKEFKDLCLAAFKKSLPLPAPPTAYFKQGKPVTVSLLFYYQA